MSKYKFVTNISKEEHDAFVSSHKFGSLMQLSNWATLKSSWTPYYVGVYKNTNDQDTHGELVASSLILVRSFPLGQKLAYCPRGPVVDYYNKDLTHFTLSSLKKFVKKLGAFQLRIDPLVVLREWMPEEKNIVFPPEDREALEIVDQLKALGFEPTPKDIPMAFQSWNTFILESSDDYLERIAPSKKRKYKNAVKYGCTLELATHDQIPALAEFVKGVGERHGNAVRGEAYLRKLAEAYGDAAKIFIATLNVNEEIPKVQNDIAELKSELETAGKKKKNTIAENLKSKEKFLSILTDLKDKYNADSPFLYNGKIIGWAALTININHSMEVLYVARNTDLDKFFIADYGLLDLTLRAREYGCSHCDFGGVLYLGDEMSPYKIHCSTSYQEFIGEFIYPSKKLISKLFNFAVKMRLKRS